MLQCIENNFLKLIIFVLMTDMFPLRIESLELPDLVKSPGLYINEGNQSTNWSFPSGWNHLRSSIPNLTRLRLKKRFLRKNLGEKCVTFNECPPIAICMGGICSCPYDYYIYVSPLQPELSVCRKKTKFGYFCTIFEDCKAHDANSACSDGICKCINGTHYIGSRNLLAHDRRCYKILEREGDVCDIDEQCSRLADNHHKCRCVGRCDCASVDRYGGCSICHENIKRTFFGGAAFIILLLTSRLFSRMRQHSNSQQQQNPTNNLRESGPRMLSSNTVPSVSLTRGNLQPNRRVAASLPDVFLIDHQNLTNLPSSQTTQFLPQNNHFAGGYTSARGEDSPPSYDDIVESDQLVWSEPPPAYEEVALKCIQPRKP